jgi:hypothetical protein
LERSVLEFGSCSPGILDKLKRVFCSELLDDRIPPRYPED